MQVFKIEIVREVRKISIFFPEAFRRILDKLVVSRSNLMILIELVECST